MSSDAILILIILAAAIVLFATEWVRVDVVAIGVVVALMLSGVLSTAEALSGFSNTAVLTIASLFVVGGAVMQTGLAGMVGRRILLVAGTSELRLMVVLMTAVALLSGFMSDTGTVAVLLPAVVILAREAKLNPSKLLIPLAFGALFGGAMTLIGTPPNIIVSDLLIENNLEPFRFFSFMPMGLILLLLGVGFMAVAGRRLLPDRKLRVTGQPIEHPEALVAHYRLPDNLFRVRVRRRSRLVGLSLAAAGLGRDFDVIVLDVLRRVEPRPGFRLVRSRQQPVNAVPQNVAPQRVSVLPGTAVIEVDDVLLVQGEAGAVGSVAAAWNLGVQPAHADDEDALITEEVGVAEVVLPPRSHLIGQTLVKTRFGKQYGLTVLGINHRGDENRQDFKNIPLTVGDILLVQGRWQNIVGLREKRRDFVVLGQPEAMMGAPNQQKAGIALLVLLGMLLIMIAGALPLAAASMLAGLLMVLAGCLTMDEAYQAIDWKSVVLVAGMLPMSIALEKVALVDAAAQGLVFGLGGFGPRAILVGLFLLTSLFTQVLSNTATTVVAAPIALAAAQTLGVAPQAFLMAVAIAASMAFASPVASPVNTLVMGAGNYRFGDYFKVGLPMILLALTATAVLLPWLWPF